MIELVVDGNNIMILNDDGTIDVKKDKFGSIVENDNILDFVNIQDTE